MIKITKNGQYSNINLREMDDKETIVLEKIFAEGKAVKSKFQPMKKTGNKLPDGKDEMVVDESKPVQYNYQCKVKLGEEEVSFFINKEKDHKLFCECGGIGDKVAITCSKKIVTRNKKDAVDRTYVFEKVE